MLAEPFIPICLNGRSLKSFLNAPASIYPRVVSVPVYTEMGHPIPNRLFNPIYRHYPNSGAIVDLSSLSTPSAVIRFIITIIIYPIKTMLVRRFRPHILKKIFKSISAQPSVADLYTSSPISMIGSIGSTLAPILHSPIRVALRFVSAVGSTPKVWLGIHIGHYNRMSIYRQDKDKYHGV